MGQQRRGRGDSRAISTSFAGLTVSVNYVNIARSTVDIKRIDAIGGHMRMCVCVKINKSKLKYEITRCTI